MSCVKNSSTDYMTANVVHFETFDAQFEHCDLIQYNVITNTKVVEPCKIFMNAALSKFFPGNTIRLDDDMGLKFLRILASIFHVNPGNYFMVGRIGNGRWAVSMRSIIKETDQAGPKTQTCEMFRDYMDQTKWGSYYLFGDKGIFAHTFYGCLSTRVLID